VVTPVSAHHKYQQQYIELCRSLAWLGELQLTSAERGGAADYMQTIRHLIISRGRPLTKKLIYNTTVCFYICLRTIWYTLFVIFICSVVLILIWVWWGGRLHGRAWCLSVAIYLCGQVLGTPQSEAWNESAYLMIHVPLICNSWCSKWWSSPAYRLVSVSQWIVFDGSGLSDDAKLFRFIKTMEDSA